VLFFDLNLFVCIFTSLDSSVSGQLMFCLVFGSSMESHIKIEHKSQHYI